MLNGKYHVFNQGAYRGKRFNDIEEECNVLTSAEISQPSNYSIANHVIETGTAYEGMHVQTITNDW